MSKIQKILCIILSVTTFVSLILSNSTAYALSSDSISFVILSDYKVNTKIGDDFYLLAATTNGSQVKWKSSDSKIATVNTYGKVTTKRAGTALITAKIRNAEASCIVTVAKTLVALSHTTATLERGQSLRLSATTSNDSVVTWKSSKKSVAVIDEYGMITCKKPGETVITATADGTSETCILTVKFPTISLNKSSIQLYRGQAFRLLATVSSNVTPTWKSNKKTVATIDEYGTITAKKHGTATISAIVDGVTQTCEVTVLKPDITLSSSDLTLKKGAHITLTASVSSNAPPQWSSSNTNIVTVNTAGEITALQKGKAYIYAAEDGTKVKCTIHVTD